MIGIVGVIANPGARLDPAIEGGTVTIEVRVAYLDRRVASRSQITLG